MITEIAWLAEEVSVIFAINSFSKNAFDSTELKPQTKGCFVVVTLLLLLLLFYERFIKQT